MSDALKIDEPIGAGYLHHFDAWYQSFLDDFAAVGGTVDMYEVLGVQFNSEPDALGRLAKSLDKPLALHSFEMCLGNVDRPPDSTLDRIRSLSEIGGVSFIGEHIAFMGTSYDYAGAFVQPPCTDDQTEVLVANVIDAQQRMNVPIIVENPSQMYSEVGGTTIGEQMRTVAEEADCDLLLSLSNISISDRFHPQDREAFLSEIPLERVREIHVLCGNEAEERQPGREKAREEQAWAIKMLHELAADKSVRPAAVIFELEAGTDAYAEPERVRDFVDMARSLFFSEASTSKKPAKRAAKKAAKRSAQRSRRSKGG